ncbi:MAG: exodeoxyribonuclease VII large subunit [Bacteroidetes bacterium]|nr:MAG: exodeoxyribonuclease VII large subunit [Bacteroidota bacterium]
MGNDEQVSHARQVFSLFEITESISRMFRKHYASPYWIKAEISKLNLYPHSGHCYPDLVDRVDGKVKSQVRGIIWRDDLFEITRRFENVTREPLREGINIMFQAYVKFSSEYGLSLQIIDIEPLFTLGELAKEKMETIARLKDEGIFNLNRVLEMPLLPQRLAIISANTSKGYSDLMVTLNGNQYGYKFHTRLFHAVLQGEGAIESIRKQLLVIKDLRQQFDAVLIIRGGGDEIGMACYDSYILSREVASFPLPVISGIGHSTNETVVEMVASINKITPTDVAYFLIGCFRTFHERIEAAAHMLELASKVILDTNENRFRILSQDFSSASQIYINQQHQELSFTAMSIRDSVNAAVFNHRIALSRYETTTQSGPGRIIAQFANILKEKEKLLMFHNGHLFKKHSTSIDHIENKVRLLDPVNVLKRGFSITRFNGKALVPGINPAAGDKLETETLTGKIHSIVTENQTK